MKKFKLLLVSSLFVLTASAQNYNYQISNNNYNNQFNTNISTCNGFNTQTYYNGYNYQISPLENALSGFIQTVIINKQNRRRNKRRNRRNAFRNNRRNRDNRVTNVYVY